MIKTTPDQIAKSVAAINMLLSMKLPAKAAYAVSKLARVCKEENDAFDRDRAKVFEDAGCTVKDSNYVHETDPAKLEEAIQAAQERRMVDCEINALPLDIEHFKDVELPGDVFLSLDWAMKPF